MIDSIRYVRRTAALLALRAPTVVHAPLLHRERFGRLFAWRRVLLPLRPLLRRVLLLIFALRSLHLGHRFQDFSSSSFREVRRSGLWWWSSSGLLAGRAPGGGRASHLSASGTAPRSPPTAPMAMSVATPTAHAAARHIPVAAARRLAASRSAAVAPLRRALLAPRSSRVQMPARRSNHGIVTAGWNDFTWGSGSIVTNEPAAADGGLRSIVLKVDGEMAKGTPSQGSFASFAPPTTASPRSSPSPPRRTRTRARSSSSSSDRTAPRGRSAT